MPETIPESWHFPWERGCRCAPGPTSVYERREITEGSCPGEQRCSSTEETSQIHSHLEIDAADNGDRENVVLGGPQSCPVPLAPKSSGASLRCTASPLSLTASLSTDTRSMPPYEQRQDWPLVQGTSQQHTIIPTEPTSRSKAPAAGDPASEPETTADENSFITGVPLVCLMVGLMLAMFLISLDRTIISTVRRCTAPPPLSLLALTSSSLGHPVHHASVPVDARYWVVWLGIHGPGLRLPTPIR